MPPLEAVQFLGGDAQHLLAARGGGNGPGQDGDGAVQVDLDAEFREVVAGQAFA
ncbi:hypothetical protein [Streptomyces globosus]|uniref:hypothetical protein n=1 Tax=Streptomyces globosus TaxID=68209 RepID=UPI0036266765